MDTQTIFSSIVHPEGEGAELNRRLEAFKRLVPHLRGALWWGRDEEIRQRNSTFVRRDDRDGHPLLSLRKDEVKSRCDCIPMLFGTSGGRISNCCKTRCIDVVGLTCREPERHTYFGSIIEPALYSVAEMMDGVSPKKGEREFVERDRHEIIRDGERAVPLYRKWHEVKAMVPNQDKPVVSDDEMKMIDDFCLIHQL